MIHGILNKHCLACLVTAEHRIISIDDIIMAPKKYAVVTYKCQECNELRQFNYCLEPIRTMEQIRKEYERSKYEI